MTCLDFMMEKTPAGIKWWKCPDFEYSVDPTGVVRVFDGAEGCSYAMTMEKIHQEMVIILLEDDIETIHSGGHLPMTTPVANSVAREILSKSTKLGLCTFVKNYCEV